MKMYNKRFETVLKILFVPIILWSSSFSFVSTARATTITDAGEVVKDSVIKMISHVFVMDTYAQMIVELPSLQLKKCSKYRRTVISKNLTRL
ncbi:hypothetical protein ACT7C1_11620 [Bacillus paranthracis]